MAPENEPLTGSDAAAEASTATLQGNGAKKEADAAPMERTATAVSSSRVVNGVEYSRGQFALVFVALALGVFLAALDQTIVAVAIPSIVTDFQTFSGISWIGTAYFLSSTPLIPTYGKLSDVFGRKYVFLTGIVIFEIGSLICGLAPNMNVLIIGRAIAGLGGGGMLPMVIIIISDLVSLRDRPKYQGIIGACFGLASVAGPLMGGAFTEKLSWRWCFLINLPVGAITVVVVIFVLRLPQSKGNLREKMGLIDYAGTFWLAATTVLLVYALTAGGNDFAWDSAAIISMFCVSAVCAVIFVFVEKRFAKAPIIPFELWTVPHAVLVWASAFFLGMSFFSITYFIPIFFQVVNGSTPTDAGIHTIPLVMGLVVMAMGSGIAVSKTGLTTPFIHLGSAMIMVGAGLLSTLTATSGQDKQVGYLLLAGMGVGLLVQTINLNGQGVVKPHQLAPMIANVTFWQILGAVFGIAINGTVFSNSLNSKLQASIPAALVPFVKNNPSKIQAAVAAGTIPAQFLDAITSAYTDSLSLVFKVAIGTAGMILILSLFLKRERLAKEAQATEMAAV